MNFEYAMKDLKKGFKVKRRSWNNTEYIDFEEDKIKEFKRIVSNYHFDSDIIFSEGWIVVDDENDKFYSFYEAIKFLNEGKKIKLPTWEGMYIFLDKMTKEIIVSRLIMDDFIPSAQDLFAIDWEIV